MRVILPKYYRGAYGVQRSLGYFEMSEVDYLKFRTYAVRGGEAGIASNFWYVKKRIGVNGRGLNHPAIASCRFNNPECCSLFTIWVAYQVSGSVRIEEDHLPVEVPREWLETSKYLIRYYSGPGTTLEYPYFIIVDKISPIRTNQATDADHIQVWDIRQYSSQQFLSYVNITKDEAICWRVFASL
jgi:hypothetical protein